MDRGKFIMAKNTDKGFRKGSVDNRTQVLNKKSSRYTKRDDATGEFMDVKTDEEPFKGVAKEIDERRR
jgi:hypothetical protein